MQISVYQRERDMAAAAAEEGYRYIKEALAARGFASIVLATGTSQLQMLANLVKKPINWKQVTVFHLDEYLGLAPDHPASFVRYLYTNFAYKVRPKAFHFIDGKADNAQEECSRLNGLISQELIDVAFVGIGENGHLAFNDPPADFENPHPYIVVKLDKKCRLQQVNEGWFPSLKKVPKAAITMSIRWIMQSKRIVCTVPSSRKALAVRDCLDKPISPQRPASILQKHPHCTVYLDQGSVVWLQRRPDLQEGQKVVELPEPNEARHGEFSDTKNSSQLAF